MTTVSAVCCGERPPGVAGRPEVVACKLCPNSSGYWRNEGPVVSSPWVDDAPEPVAATEPKPKPVPAGPPAAPPGFPGTEGGSLW